MTPLDSIENGKTETKERNWIPLAVAVFLILAVVISGFMLAKRPKANVAVTPVNATPDAYAASLPITKLVMSESSNLAGGKVTYIDGHIANTGNRTVNGILVQVLFLSYTKEVAQNETMPLSLIRMREPYVDTESVAAEPLKSGDQKDFRLIFDKVSPEWAGALPEIRVMRVIFR